MRKEGTQSKEISGIEGEHEAHEGPKIGVGHTTRRGGARAAAQA